MTLITSFWNTSFIITASDTKVLNNNIKFSTGTQKIFCGTDFVLAARGEYIVKKKQGLELLNYMNNFVSVNDCIPFFQLKEKIINELLGIFDNKIFDFQLLITGHDSDGNHQEYIDFSFFPFLVINDLELIKGLRFNQEIVNLDQLENHNVISDIGPVFDKFTRIFCEFEKVDIKKLCDLPYTKITAVIKKLYDELSKDKYYNGIGGDMQFIVYNSEGKIIDSSR